MRMRQAQGVENGLLAVHEFESSSQHRSPFDIILMDGCMPVMNGIDATKRLRAMNITIPIVGLTGNAMIDDIREFLNVGVNAVLTKPVQQNELQLTMKRLLSI